MKSCSSPLPPFGAVDGEQVSLPPTERPPQSPIPPTDKFPSRQRTGSRSRRTSVEERPRCSVTASLRLHRQRFEQEHRLPRAINIEEQDVAWSVIDALCDSRTMLAQQWRCGKYPHRLVVCRRPVAGRQDGSTMDRVLGIHDNRAECSIVFPCGGYVMLTDPDVGRTVRLNMSPSSCVIADAKPPTRLMRDRGRETLADDALPGSLARELVELLVLVHLGLQFAAGGGEQKCRTASSPW